MVSAQFGTDWYNLVSTSTLYQMAKSCWYRLEAVGSDSIATYFSTIIQPRFQMYLWFFLNLIAINKAKRTNLKNTSFNWPKPHCIHIWQIFFYLKKIKENIFLANRCTKSLEMNNRFREVRRGKWTINSGRRGEVIIICY